MSTSFVVVDGSNIATEGRSTPSLGQLDQAVREFQEQFPDPHVIVVVDATFRHRIQRSERGLFDDAVAHGEIVLPPAGAVGRGDAFLLRVAARAGAQVLSNDSFQEFHGEHPWLFGQGRLIGGTPVPGVGWIFTPRLPVRATRRAATATHPDGARASRSPEGAQAEKGKGSEKAPRKRTTTTKSSRAEKPAKITHKAAKAPSAKAHGAKKAAGVAGRASKASEAKPATRATRARKAQPSASSKKSTGATGSKGATGGKKPAKKKAKTAPESASRRTRPSSRRSGR